MTKIFPELSKTEINSMNASIHFLKGLFRRLDRKKKEKVFIIGLHKTGTSSIGRAFERLGYRVCGSFKSYKKRYNHTINRADLFNELKSEVKKFDCFQDTPWFIFYKEIFQIYPDSKFILLIRSEKSWLKSIQNHFGKNTFAYHNWIYNKKNPIEDPSYYQKFYKKHNQDIINYFANNSNFTVLKLEKDFNWPKLCNFLNVKCPSDNFPYVNKAKNRRHSFSVLTQIIKKFTKLMP